jgi:2-dehydro-3-deoxyphosphogluconate aldolase/(4S)-4-hydroxy-2-oxoglutarate aldolase
MTLLQLHDARAVAVVRAHDADEALATVDALAAAGLRAIELTFTTPGAAAAIAEARRRLDPDVLLGAGTITTAAQVDAAEAAGADFLVSPHLDARLLERMLETGLLAIPGTLTPSEIAGALRSGAEVVKLFPASAVGVSYLKALFGPFPGLQVMPTGGVTVENAKAWLDAGAVAVGLGGGLRPDNAARLLAELREEATV